MVEDETVKTNVMSHNSSLREVLIGEHLLELPRVVPARLVVRSPLDRGAVWLEPRIAYVGFGR